MRTPLLLILLLFLWTKVNSQSIFQTIGSENIGLAHCAANSTNIWSGFHNAAGLASLHTTTMAIHMNVLYGGIGLMNSAAGFTKTTKYGTAFAGMARFGDKLYNEHKFTLAYGSEVGLVKIGGGINYLQYQIQDFGTLNSYSIDLGVQAQLSPELSIGSYVQNISRSYLKKDYKVYTPTLIYMGIHYQPFDFFQMLFEVEKNLSNKALLKAALKYELSNKLFLSTGIKGDSWESFYGLGLEHLRLNFVYAYSNHPNLGSSHAIDIAYKLGR